MGACAGLLLNSLRGAAVDLLRATHQADQAPWSDGPQQAIAVGSLIRLLVTPHPPLRRAYTQWCTACQAASFTPGVIGVQVAVHTWVRCEQLTWKAQCMEILTPDM